MVNKINALLPPGHPWGQRIIHLETVDSTNSYAKQLARQGAPAGTVVIADHQTGGRGRLGRNFSSPEGLGLYFSLILRPNCTPEELMHLTCAAGLAASEAVRVVGGVTPGIKWPNDLVIGHQKLGGILTELSIRPDRRLVDYAIIGIGINCLQKDQDFPAEIRPIATSLALAGGQPDRAALAAGLIEQLSHMSAQLLTQKQALMAAYCDRCITVGREISVVRADRLRHGTALGVDADGGLLVRYTDGTEEAVACGEVSIRGMYGYL